MGEVIAHLEGKDHDPCGVCTEQSTGARGHLRRSTLGKPWKQPPASTQVPGQVGPALGSLLRAWDEVWVLGALLRILYFVCCTGKWA